MRIILVDDESSVLPEMLAVLKSIPGHEVRVAANSQKAHEHAAALGGVDLLITDVVMEPTDGFTLRGEIQASNPNVRVVFISQYDLSDYAEHLGGAATLPKPVDGTALRGVVESAAAALAAPVARPVPQPVASGVRQPTAVPQAVPQPVASGVRQPTAVPQAVAQPATPAKSPKTQPLQAVPVSGVRVAPAQGIPSPIASGISAPRATVVADSLIGVLLGDYRIERVIGTGIWGKVYAGWSD